MHRQRQHYSILCLYFFNYGLLGILHHDLRLYSGVKGDCPAHVIYILKQTDHRFQTIVFGSKVMGRS